MFEQSPKEACHLDSNLKGEKSLWLWWAGMRKATSKKS